MLYNQSAYARMHEYVTHNRDTNAFAEQMLQ